MASSTRFVVFYGLFACLVVLQVHLVIYSNTVLEDSSITQAPTETVFEHEESVTEKLERISQAGKLPHRFQGITFHSNNHTCLVQHENTHRDQSWHRRAPSAVIIGAMKSGTQALSFYLRQHPNIASTREAESHFFDAAFDTYATPNGILQHDARAMYASYFRSQSISARNDIMTNTSLVALDKTPMYFFWSDVVPARMFCVAPWVKLILVLRDPVDRAFSQYGMMVRRGKTSESFETWVERDFQRLYSRGVIEENSWESRNEPVAATAAFTGSNAERKAWMNYSGQTSGRFSDSTDTLVGRGLYAFQLQHWWDAMDKANKPRTDMIILNSADMKRNPSNVVNRVAEFLNIPSFQLQSDEAMHVGDYEMGEMKNETRKLLQDFYRPYNQQLYKMLSSEWDGAWDS